MSASMTEREWFWPTAAEGGAPEGRQCGSCYACCVWLGIIELKKYAGQCCTHVKGGIDPTKRCSIYDRRPKACADYRCMWRIGYGPDWLQPSNSGILITPYEPQMPGANVAFTMTVIDPRRAEKIWRKVMTELLMVTSGVELRVLIPETKRAMLFTDGNVYACKLLPQGKGDYEGLQFETDLENPIGHYMKQDFESGEELSAFKTQLGLKP